MEKLTLCFLLCLSALTQAVEPEPKKTLGNEFITVNIGIDIKGVERASENFKQASTELASSIKQLAENPELSPEQQQQLDNTLQQLNEISTTLNNSVKALPQAVAATKAPILETTAAVRGEIRTLIIKFAIIAILLFSAIIFTIYWSIIRPTKKILLGTSDNLTQIAQALEKTSGFIEKTSARQQANEKIESHKENHKNQAITDSPDTKKA